MEEKQKKQGNNSRGLITPVTRVVTLVARARKESNKLSRPGRVITRLVTPVISMPGAGHARNDLREERKREKETANAGHQFGHDRDQADPSQLLLRHGRSMLTGSHSPVKHGRDEAQHTHHIA